MLHQYVLCKQVYLPFLFVNGIRIRIRFQTCQPLRFGRNYYDFGVLITPLRLSHPLLRLLVNFNKFHYFQA